MLAVCEISEVMTSLLEGSDPCCVVRIIPGQVHAQR